MVSRGYLVLPPAPSGAEFKAASGYANSDVPEIYSGDCTLSRDRHSATFLGNFFFQYLMILAMKIFSLILPMKIFLVALKPVSLVHSPFFDESGSTETTTTFPYSLLFFSCVPK